MADPINPPGEADRFERHEGEWHEWSLGTHDCIVKGKPSRMFVRVEDGHLIEVTGALVTSWNAGARELGEGAQSRTIHLTSEMAKFLIDVLPKALERKDVDDDA